MTLLLPTVLHVCFVWPTVSRTMLAASAVSYSRWLLAVNAAGLIAVPAAYFLYFYKRALWFLRDYEAAYAAVEKHRRALGIASYALGLVFGILRLLHSRYSYLFSGFVPPFNFLTLLAVGAAVPVLATLSSAIYQDSIETTANRKHDARAQKTLWGTALGLSIALTVALCMTLGMAPFFIMCSAMAVAALWAYFVDRKRNAGQYTMFMFCSSVALLWWMFNSFSFVVSDLKVFGETGTIPAPLLAGSMLWVYIFGAWLLPLSFQKEAKFLFACILVFHSQKVLWIERVLYSQNEESTYPPQFVLATSAIGALAAYKLYVNGVITAGPASVVVGAYVSKIIVYASDSVEIDYRWSDGTSPWAIIRETLVAYGAWGAIALYVFASMRGFILGGGNSNNNGGNAATVSSTTSSSFARGDATIAAIDAIDAEDQLAPGETTTAAAVAADTQQQQQSTLR